MPELDLTGHSPTGLRKTVGFIGVGVMGGPMARNLAKAGVDLIVYDLSADAVEQVVALGARAAGSIAEVAGEADIVLVCVVDDGQVEAVVDQIIDAGRPRQIVVVHSTIRPATMTKLATRAAGTGIGLVDAPVSGATPASEAGTLTIITAGDIDLVTQCLPVFSVTGSRVYHLGKLGNGQAMKVVNNIMLHANHLIILEALRLAEAYGLEEEEVVNIAMVSTGRSWPLEYLGLMDDLVQTHTLAGTDAVYKLFTKEQWSAVLESRGMSVALPFTSLACAISKEMIQEREANLRKIPAKPGA